MKKIFIIYLFISLNILLINNSGHCITVRPNEALIIDFYFDGIPVDKEEPSSTPKPDLLNLRMTGRSSLSVCSTTYNFYDGYTLLNTFTREDIYSWAGIAYKSYTNTYPYFGSNPSKQIDFNRIYDGTIEGRIEVIPVFKSPGFNDSIDANVDLILAKQGSLYGYRPYSDPITSVNVVPISASVDIDIKPNKFPNSINPRSRGEIAVAILSNDCFDAADVDEYSVLFGVSGTEAEFVHSALEDTDHDGDIDLILHFNIQETDIMCGDTLASLSGETLSGQVIEGTDTIKTVGCK